MKALLLAAAKSRKLFPFSNSRPKSMIPIAGTPILETIIGQLVSAGIKEAWVVVGHHNEIIQDHFHYGKEFGIKLDYVVQEEEEGIGHAVSLCEDAIRDDDSFLLVYGDALMSGNPFLTLLNRYNGKKTKALATISHPLSEGSYGNIYLSHNMKISKLVENSEQSRHSNYIFGGSFMLQSDCFSFLKDNNHDMLSYFQHLISGNAMEASLWEDHWIDLSRPWHILQANQVMMEKWNTTQIPKSVRLEPNVTIKGPVLFGENVHIGSGTAINGPCYIGPNVFLGDNCLIRQNASIGENSEIGYGTEVKNSVLFGNSRVGRLSFIGDSVLGYNVQFGSGTLTVNYNTIGDDIYFAEDEENKGRINTHLLKLGAFIGDNSTIGTGHTIGPGTHIMPNTNIADRISISNNSLEQNDN
ncbi:MAG: NTP transferase domain-containing protein [Proteobacteria bacterium]|nr:NTP transferase domain-containing protein [Pseudomonadota bacterium]